jgi:hypothetical protein
MITLFSGLKSRVFAENDGGAGGEKVAEISRKRLFN